MSHIAQLSHDLLRVVEVFADDSNFKSRVIDSSADAIAVMLKRSPEVNGFLKSDTMHLPFTHGLFKLCAALHCFNPDIQVNPLISGSPPRVLTRFAHTKNYTKDIHVDSLFLVFWCFGVLVFDV